MTKNPITHENLTQRITTKQKAETLYMIHVPIKLSEESGHNKNSEHIAISIPFKSGVLFDLDKLSLFNNQQDTIFYHAETLKYWPNKSIKWIRLFFQYSLAPKQNAELYLSSDNAQKPLSASTIKVIEDSKRITIDTGTASFEVNKDELGVFYLNSEKQYSNLISQKNSVILTDSNDIQYRPIIHTIKHHDSTGKDKQLQLNLSISGVFQSSIHEISTKFETNIVFFLNKTYTKWTMSIHNPEALFHHGGKWDLGNENSQHFKSLNVHQLKQGNNSLSYQLSTSDSWQKSNAEHFLIHQESSGGKNWRSANHLNRKYKIPIEFNGYKITDDIGNEYIVEGRATPTFHFNSDYTSSTTQALTIHIKNFWQKFPKSIKCKNKEVIIGLFPSQSKDGFELQAGEKKSDTFFIDYSEQQDNLNELIHPIHTTVCPDYIKQTNVLPLFAKPDNESEYNKIITEGLNIGNGFFNKREIIDEFGWRNFGDLYADHETLEFKGKGELISHYNNQYDPLYGFLKQYLSSGDRRWFELAKDLADHIVNIDIYHTESDRCEYNNGLFWHTDHYLPAETATHRTYSKNQTSNAYQGHAGSGGPGGQHCYTTGLMLHYCLTGENSSKLAVLKLTEWITNVYEGSGTVADYLLAIKNKNRKDIKNPLTGKYPLDRGTGHYVIALIDAFELTSKQSYLDRASIVIKNTIHPQDNVELRELINIEECWFYTVFLQAVYRYLHTKEKLKQFDSSFNYCHQAFLHYANWMVKYEQPYLNTPEKLEYPNHTWAAQDIRKANVLYMASYYATNEQQQLLLKEKADELYQYVVLTLQNEPTRSFTRILSILMQNHGVKSYVESNTKARINELTHTDKHRKMKNKDIITEFFSTLSNTSISSEIEWFRKKAPHINNILTKLGF